MRIITGKLKGRKIPMPDSTGVRPTSDRAKEGIFSALQARTDFNQALVLDLFAGSGNLGFEALSRGCDSVVFVEKNPVCTELIEEVATQFGIVDQTQIYTGSVEWYLEHYSSSFDIIFADPPYDLSFMQSFPDLILEGQWLKEEGIFILEHDKYNNFESDSRCIYSKAYGRTTVSMFKK